MLPETITSERLRLPLWTPDEAADILAGRQRPTWHRDYPRQDDRDAAKPCRNRWLEGEGRRDPVETDHELTEAEQPSGQQGAL